MSRALGDSRPATTGRHGIPAAPARAAMLALVLVAASVLLLLAGLAAGSDGWSFAWADEWTLLREIRAPRSMGAWLAGALLGFAGAVAQGLFRNPLAERSSNRPNVLWGRVGPSGNDAPLESQRLPREDLDMSNLRSEVLWGRVGPAGRGTPTSASTAAKLPPEGARTGRGVPEERYGVLMVFRTFERVSYAIIMDTSRPVNVSDVVRNP